MKEAKELKTSRLEFRCSPQTKAKLGWLEANIPTFYKKSAAEIISQLIDDRVLISEVTHDIIFVYRPPRKYEQIEIFPEDFYPVDPADILKKLQPDALIYPAGKTRYDYPKK